MQIPIIGQAYTHESQDVNFQRCVNLIPAIGGDGASLTLIPTPGKRILVDVGTSPIRAIVNWDDTIYVVGNDVVYKLTINEVTKTATASSIGNMASIVGKPLSYAQNTTQVIFVSGAGNPGFILTPSTDTITEITDAAFVGGETVEYMDGYFIYNNGNALKASAINDGLSWDALDSVDVEADNDDVIAVIQDKRELWALGAKTTEIYYNSANTSGFPFSRREGASFNQGCAAKFSPVKIDNALMWLDDRGYIVRNNGYGISVVSTPAINAAIQEYTTISDAYAFKYTSQGHLCYVISFPSEKKTWVYNLTTQLWHEQAYFNPLSSELEHDLAICSTRYKQWWLQGNRKNSEVYLVDAKYYKDGNDLIKRLRTSQHFGLEYQFLSVSELELHLEAGKGLTTSGSPYITLRYSNDGGYTWSHKMHRDMGKLGEYNTRVRWNRLGAAREWLFEISTTEPVKFAIIGGYVQAS